MVFSLFISIYLLAAMIFSIALVGLIGCIGALIWFEVATLDEA